MKMRTRVSYHGIDWVVEGDFKPRRPARPYLRNGDPGYPAEPEDLFGASIWIEQGRSRSEDLQDILEDEAIDKLIDMALEAFTEDYDQKPEGTDDDYEIPL